MQNSLILKGKSTLMLILYFSGEDRVHETKVPNNLPTHHNFEVLKRDYKEKVVIFCLE